MEQRLADEDLVRWSRRGDRQAFAELVGRYQKQIYSLAYRLTNNREDALDLTQEIFLRIFQFLDRYDPQRPFFPWMYKVASNVCYTHLKRKPQENLPIDNVIELAPLVPRRETQPEDYYEAKEIQELVQQAMMELPEKYRMPLVLRYLEDLSYQEIADFLDLPVSTIETRLYRGKALLQKRLSRVMERGTRRELPGS